jgi:1-acyl-sn-glycerol-3-phosphate acyltransferase
MIRGLVYWIAGLVMTFLLTITVFICYPFIGKDSDFSHNISRIWSRIALGFLCGVKLDVEGAENIEPDKNYIIVSNHRSYTDIFTASWAVPLQFRWLAKSSLFRIPFLGPAMRICGYIPIEREHSISASKSLEVTKEALLRGRSVWIFPEGTRTPKTVLGRFKRGAFLLAKETGLPVLPVILVNTDKIFRAPLRIKPNRVTVIISKPLYYNDFKASLSPAHRTSDKQALNAFSESINKIIQTGYDSNAS